MHYLYFYDDILLSCRNEKLLFLQDGSVAVVWIYFKSWAKNQESRFTKILLSKKKKIE